MFSLKYLAKTLKYYIFTIAIMIATVGFNVGFSFISTEAYDAKVTYDNFTSLAISYDKGNDGHNTFAYFGSNAYAKASNTSNKTINGKVYQFLDNTTYDEESIINPKNIVLGTFSVLNHNEAAISKNIAKTYGLSLNDTIYINEDIACKIKYITHEFYQIKDVDFSSNESSIFIGIDTLSTSRASSYLKFGAKALEQHNDLYAIDGVKQKINQTFYGFSTLTFALTLVSVIIINSFRRKEEASVFHILWNNGYKHIFLNICLNESFYMLPGLIIDLIIMLAIQASLIQTIFGILGLLLASLIHILIVYYERRFANAR